MIKLIPLPFLILFVLLGCNTLTSSIPSDISDKQFWDDSKEIVLMLEENIKDISPLSVKQEQLISRYQTKYVDKIKTDNLEKQLFGDIVKLSHYFTNYILMDHEDSRNEQKSFLDDYLKTLNTIEQKYSIFTN